MDRREHLELTKNRKKFYQLLARLYRIEVDHSFLSQLKNMSLPTGSSEKDLKEGYEILGNYLKNCSEDDLDDLAVDFARIFLGAGVADSSAAFPYESVYTSQEAIIMQEARDQVKAIYAKKGLSVADKRAEFFEDHIAIELDFMAFLCKEAQSILDLQDESEASACLEEQIDFLNGHLLNWVPSFCKDIEKYADTEFYKGVAKITSGYLNLDKRILESLAG